MRRKQKLSRNKIIWLAMTKIPVLYLFIAGVVIYLLILLPFSQKGCNRKGELKELKKDAVKIREVSDSLEAVAVVSKTKTGKLNKKLSRVRSKVLPAVDSFKPYEIFNYMAGLDSQARQRNW